MYKKSDNGDRAWYENDVLHKLDGPALIYNNGDKEYRERPLKQENPSSHQKKKEKSPGSFCSVVSQPADNHDH